VPNPVRRVGVAATYVLSRLARRDSGRWVFGNLKGFRDDPRYLAEHVVQTRPGVEVWWIARTEAEARAARAAGIRVAMRATREAGQVQRSAGVAFLSNGFQDLQPAQLGGAFVVDLRHGQGLKVVLLDMLPSPDLRTPLVEAARNHLRRWWIARRLAEVDMIVAPGQWAKERYVTAFRCPPSRIKVLGSPRFDVLQGGPAYDRVAGVDLRARLGAKPGQYLVVWMPTWREGGDAAWLPHLERGQLDAAAVDSDLLLLVKPHPYSDWDVYRGRLPTHPNVRLLTEAEIDANALLRESDALITDYSSAAFDYAILDRPIFFLAPDLDQYSRSHALYAPFESVTGGDQHATWSTLLPAIAAEDQGGAGRRAAGRIREFAETNATPGSCERIVLEVAREIGLAIGRG
jgi:CDP-glycerol glycerophosphotransferase (TagB/SpsB family)